MKKFLFVLVFGSVSVAGLDAAWATTGNAGISCQKWQTIPGPTYYTNGASTSGGGGGDFICPVNGGTLSGNNVTVASAWLNYLDGNSTSDFLCVPVLTDTVGNTYWGSIKYTCSNPGGCYDEVTSSTGSGYISWTGSDLPTLSSFTWYSDNPLVVICVLPPPGSISSSFVYSYGVN